VTNEVPPARLIRIPHMQHVTIAAREDREWEPPAVDDSAGLPPQLPGGISWRDSLPTSIAWLRQPGSIDTLRRVNALASARLRRQYGLD
jgi:hypothetical protein